MTFLESILLGVLEGLTEFLPVSSTGHLILASELLGIPDGPFLTSFTIAIQLGSILAVVVMYFRQFLDLEVLKRLAVAFLPTGIIALTLYRLVKDVLLGNPQVVVYALFIGGVAIILIERFRKNVPEPRDGTELRDLSYLQCFLLGLYQASAIVPGVSRSGATVMGGLLMGLPRATVLSFSFLLAVPTLLAATAYDLYKTPEALMGGNFGLMAAGFITAFLVALLVIRYALLFVKRYSFEPFGWYRIVLAALFAFFVL